MSDNKNEIGLSGEEISAFKRTNRDVEKFNSWMINISLASVGFLFTVLLQIKLNPISEVSSLAISTLIILFVSIAFGFYFKITFNFPAWYGNTKDTLNSLLKILNHMKHSSNEESNINIDNAIKFLETHKNTIDETESKDKELSFALLAFKEGLPLIMQASTLCLGVLLSCIYMVLFLV